MKKITLVLCACAIAFAGLLVSCSNDAGSGDVNLIYRDSTTYNYVYELTGTKVVTEESASDKTVLLTTETTTTSFKGLARLYWNVNDDTFDDYTYYSFDVFGLEEANELYKKTFTGTDAANHDAETLYTDRLSTFSLAYKNVHDDIPDLGFYKLDDKYIVAKKNFYDDSDPDNVKDYYFATWTDADWKDYVDAGGKTISVSGLYCTE